MSKHKKDRVKELATEIDILDHMIAVLVDVLEKKVIHSCVHYYSLSRSSFPTVKSR